MFENNFSKIVGERLLSITKISIETGISRSTLTSFYYKKTTNIRVSTLLKICDYLEIELLELIGFMPLKKSKEKKL